MILIQLALAIVTCWLLLIVGFCLEDCVKAWNTRTPDPRIAALEAENERLREALHRIANTCEQEGKGGWMPTALAEVARAALARKEKE